MTMKNRHINDEAGGCPLRNPVTRDTVAAAETYRHDRVRRKLVEQDCSAILLYDPVNIRYATNTTNMQVWTMHNSTRYAIIFAEGPTILWEFHNCDHLADGSGPVDEIRHAVNWSYLGAGSRMDAKARQWSDEIARLVKQYRGNNLRLAMDRATPNCIQLLEQQGLEPVEGQSLMEEARKIKSAEELELIRWTVQVCEQGIKRMHDELQPGMTENELWAWLHYENIRHGGQWIETRLLASGPRTNPWMQESSDRVMREGEIICFDTDLVGPYGYCADISRAWTVGHVAPEDEQRRLYSLAYEQVHTNMALLKAGVSYREFSDRAWNIPPDYYPNRYSCIAHGVGMVDENPFIAHKGEDWRNSGYDGVFEENMVVCLESYIGAKNGAEGIKLEQQVLVTGEGCQPLTSYPWQDNWLI